LDPTTNGTTRVRVADGVSVAVVAGGPLDGAADGPPVLLVHGLASNARTWEPVTRRLAHAGHPVAAVDQRGHGHSDKPADGYDFGTLCDDLIGVLDHLGWRRAVVVGQSTGGNVALELAVRTPERLVAAIGVDGGLIQLADRWPDWPDCEDELRPPRIEGRPAREVEGWIRGAHPAWSDEAIDVTMANFEHRADGTVRPWLDYETHLTILRSLWEHRPSAVLGGLAVPSLFVMADTGDAWVADKRQEAERAVALSSRVRVEWISPGDHDLHVGQPDELASLLSGFVASVSAARGA